MVGLAGKSEVTLIVRAFATKEGFDSVKEGFALCRKLSHFTPRSEVIYPTLHNRLQPQTVSIVAEPRAEILYVELAFRLSNVESCGHI